MKSKPLPLSFARCLLRLQNGEKLTPGEFASKDLLKRFYEDGILTRQAAGKRRSVYFCPNIVALKNYLKIQKDILSLEDYINAFDSDTSDGESSLVSTKSTKAFRKKSLQGFFIKSLNTEIVLAGESINITPEGIDLFVYQPEKLKISNDALIVGIENPECFVKFEKLAPLFPQKELVVVMRYLSQSPNRWLQTVPNKYLHFGDFDPAGIKIYISEYRTQLSGDRCSFFIPHDIEQLIERYGLDSLYDKQIHLLNNIDIQSYPEVQKLVVILDKYRKGLEQERLLSLYHLIA